MGVRVAFLDEQAEAVGIAQRFAHFREVEVEVCHQRLRVEFDDLIIIELSNVNRLGEKTR